MHKRRQIINDLKAQLQQAGYFSAVWNQRTGPARQTFPCATLFATAEQSDSEGIIYPPRIQARQMLVSISAWVRGTVNYEKLDEEMDVAASVIETTLRDPAGVDNMVLQSTEFMFDEDAPEIHAVSLIYKIDYQTEEYSPDL